MFRCSLQNNFALLNRTLRAPWRLIVPRRVYTLGMRELIKRVDSNWLRVWLACYGGSLTVLAVYLLSVVATHLPLREKSITYRQR